MTLPRLVPALALALATALPPASFSATLDDARDAFREAEFEMALGILAPLTGTGGGAVRREALTLSAQCHARLDQEDAAVKDLCAALGVDPRWQPDPTAFSPAEMRLFRVALETCPPKIPPASEAAPEPRLGVEPMGNDAPAWYQRKLVWIGAGAAAIAGVLLLGGDDSGGTTGEIVVPSFPDPPSGAAAP